MKKTGERRQFLRAQLNQFVTESSCGSIRIARVVDIGEGGLRYFSPCGPSTPEGGVVTVEFCLPGQENPIRTRARVANRKKGDCSTETSVSFLALAGKEAGEIRTWVAMRKRAEIFENLRREHLACG